MIEVGDLVRINLCTRFLDEIAIVVGIHPHQSKVRALLVLETNQRSNYHISRLEKL